MIHSHAIGGAEATAQRVDGGRGRDAAVHRRDFKNLSYGLVVSGADVDVSAAVHCHRPGIIHPAPQRKDGWRGRNAAIDRQNLLDRAVIIIGDVDVAASIYGDSEGIKATGKSYDRWRGWNASTDCQYFFYFFVSSIGYVDVSVFVYRDRCRLGESAAE